MDADLKVLEQKLSNLINLCVDLRNENAQLRQDLNAMQNDTALLKANMVKASERIEALMESLPWAGWVITYEWSQYMNELKGVDVNIMGRDFTVSCTDEERPGLMDAVNFLDKKMRDIRDSGKIVGVERIAIMTALNLSHELLNSKNGKVDVGDFKRRITQMQDQIDKVCSAK